MRNYKLDKSLLPEVWITWDKADGSSIYMNGKTGKRYTSPAPWMYDNRVHNGEDIAGRTTCGCYWSTQQAPRIWVKSGANLVYAYAKYHADIDRLELAEVTYDTTRGEYAHEWKFAGHRFFIAKDKTCLLEDGSVFKYGWKDVFPYHGGSDVRGVIRTLSRQHFNNNFVNEFKKFIGDDHIATCNGVGIKIEYPWHIERWYTTSQKVRGKGKAQKLTDELTEMKLGSLDGLGEKYPKISMAYNGWYGSYIYDILYFERINDEWCVLRSLNRNNDNSFTEGYRVYVGNDGTTRIVSKGTNGWVPARQSRHSWYGGYKYFANKEEAMQNCPRIKYILNSTATQKAHEEIDFLVTALRFPEIEQMCKLGCSKSALSITKSYTPKADLKELFGGYYNDKEKNFLRKIGMTKQQLDAYMAVNGEHDPRGYIYNDYKVSLATMRKMFGNDLTHLDVASFSKYLNACKEYRRFKCGWRGEYIMDVIGLNLDNARFFKNLVRLMNKNSNIFTVVYDAMNAYRYLHTDRRLDVDWYFDDASDAVRAHDALIELKRIQDAEDRARRNLEEAERMKKEEEKRKKLDKERAVYEYEDDNFTIRLPKNATEIVNEGSTQHICIGGYVSRHSMGDTNLFFLRRKSEPDKPFYAIEMNNSNNIVQIHGFGNRWLGNNPEAIPTVIRWLRKHGIKCHNDILTCKATGYGMSREFVPMPVVD